MNRMTAKVAGTLSIAVLLFNTAWSQEPAAALELQSDKKLGYVTLTSDLVVEDGRLAIAVGAFNKGTQPAVLQPAAVSITMASGKPVPIASLAQLEEETRARMGGRKGAHGEHAPISTAQRPIDTTAADESGGSYSGGDTIGAPIAPRARKKADPEAELKIQEAVNNLRAAVLQGVSIEPRAAASGQVVTQPFKFPRGEPRTLKMRVEFAGEQHEFEFDVPK